MVASIDVALGALAACRSTVAPILDRASEWERGFKAAAGGSGSGDGEHVGPPGAFAGLKSDPAGAIDEWLRDIDDVVKRAARLDRQRGVLVVLDAKIASALAEDAGAEGCTNCERHGVFSIAEREGRCFACYQWRRRHGGEERPRDRVIELESMAIRARRLVTPTRRAS